MAFTERATAEETGLHYPSLQLADTHAVIACYLRHRPAVEAHLGHRAPQAEQVRSHNEARFDPRGVRDRLLPRCADATADPRRWPLNITSCQGSGTHFYHGVCVSSAR
jgi:hypothetical protein